MKKSNSISKKTYRRIPILAAFLNIIFSGAGYMYNGKRILFGVLLMLFELSQWLWIYISPEAKTIASQPPGLITTLIFLLAIAIDAYQEANEINQQQKQTKKSKK